MPKLQAACTLTAQDGLDLRTAQASAKAAEGQQAILEFILLNHPLDCPDCDKGGECPLQDLTFRYGPGNTRMLFQKRTFDKPIRSEEHTSELQSLAYLVCRLLLEKKKKHLQQHIQSFR